MRYSGSMSQGIDRPLLVVTLVLLVIGVLVISSASIVISDRNFGNIYYFTMRHLAYAVLGFFVLIFASRIHYKIWRKLAMPFMVAVLLFLALVFLPEIGIRHGGASRWIDIGFISFQPSEFLKVAFILYLASWLTKKRGATGDLYRGFIPFVVMLGVVSVFLILQPDIGTLIVIGFTAAALYLLGGGRVSQIITLGFLGLAGLFILVRLAPYRMQRFLVFLYPDIDPQGLSYHLKQALIAIGSGGFWGRGFGQSLQKYNYLPEPIGDSIFAIFVEEMGFFGVIILLGLFLFLLWRSFSIARRAPDMFARLAAAGIASGIGFQIFINMAAISGLLPLTGIPLPFISYGGSALVTTLFGIGVILNISRYT